MSAGDPRTPVSGLQDVHHSQLLCGCQPSRLRSSCLLGQAFYCLEILPNLAFKITSFVKPPRRRSSFVVLCGFFLTSCPDFSRWWTVTGEHIVQTNPSLHNCFWWECSSQRQESKLRHRVFQMTLCICPFPAFPSSTLPHRSSFHSRQGRRETEPYA